MSKVIYDAEATVNLRDSEQSAITATASTSAVDFKMQYGGTFGVAINVSELVDDDADETYSFSVVGQDSAGANDVTLQTVTVTEVGEYILVLDADTVAKVAGASTEKVLVTATLGGTTPSLNYSAWITPIYGAGRP